MVQDRPSGFAASKGNLVKEHTFSLRNLLHVWNGGGSGDVSNNRYICLTVSNICVKYQIHLYDSVN